LLNQSINHSIGNIIARAKLSVCRNSQTYDETHVSTGRTWWPWRRCLSWSRRCTRQTSSFVLPCSWSSTTPCYSSVWTVLWCCWSSQTDASPDADEPGSRSEK